MIKNKKGCANNPLTKKQTHHTTQSDRVLSVLLTGEKLHRYSCRNEFGTESLHSIISNLRNKKHIPVQSKWVKRLDFIDQSKTVKLYWITPSDIARITGREVH